jgi:hypothetical protein
MDLKYQLRVQAVHGALAFCPPNHCRAFIIQYRCVNHISMRKKISHEFAVKNIPYISISIPSTQISVVRGFIVSNCIENDE